MVNNMQFTKIFIVAYAFLYIIISLFGLNVNVVLSDLPTTNNIVIDIIIFFPNVIIFLFNFLTFTTAYPIVNIILWSCRFISLLEIVLAIRGVN